MKIPHPSKFTYYQKDYCLAEDVDNIRIFTDDWFYDPEGLTAKEEPLSKNKHEYAPKNTIIILIDPLEDPEYLKYGICPSYIPDMVNCPCMPFMDVIPKDMPLRKLTKAERKEIIEPELKKCKERVKKLEGLL